ncbi:hypothetical protein GCM10010177_47890 [Actinomadura citrea]|nr:hypothetical protein GCM10010177_47890 [Actinomadura citrea]
MDTALCGQPATHVDELPHAFGDERIHRAAQEPTRLHGGDSEIGCDPQRLFGRLTVDGEMVLAAGEVIKNARLIGYLRAKTSEFVGPG